MATVPQTATGAGSLRWSGDVPAALLEAADRLAAGPGVGLVLHAQSGEIVAANQSACDLLGLSWEALIGRTSIDPRWAAVSELGYPLAGENHPAMRSLADGQAVSDFLMGVLIPAPLNSPYATGAKTRWIEIQSEPLYFSPTASNQESRPDAAAVWFTDQSASERARLASDALLTSYRLLGEAAPGVVVRVDAAGLVLQAAAAAGIEPRTIEGEHLAEWLHPDDREKFVRFWQQLVSTVSGPRQIECRWRGEGDTYRWTLLQANPIYDARGCVSGAAIGLQDVQDIRETRAELRETADELDHQRALSQIALTGANLATWDWDLVTGEVAMNERWAEIIGYSLAELLPATADIWTEQAHPADVERAGELVHRVIAGDTPSFELETRRRHRDGSWVWVRDFGSVTKLDEAGRPLRLSGVQEDVTRRKNAQAALAASEQHYRLLAENISDAVWVMGEDATLAWVSESSERMLGWPGEHLVGRDVLSLVHPDDEPAARSYLGSSTVSGSVCQCRMLTSDGDYRVVAVKSSTAGVVAGAVLSLHDIHDEVAAQKQLEIAVNSDALTGLDNREQMVHAARRAISSLEESWHTSGQNTVGALAVGIDELGTINEALTPAAGDVVIRAVAGELGAHLGSRGHLGRGTGNEFLVVVDAVEEPGALYEIAEKLRTAAKGRVELGGCEVFPTACVGIAEAGAGADAEELLRDAVTAMRMAKADGNDRIAMIDPDRAAVARQRLQLEAELRRALRANELVAWFQPIVRLATAEIVGYEALVRWERPDGQIADPGSFLPVAERSALIVEIDREILRQSVALLARIPAPLSVAVNVSGRSLGDEVYFDAVEHSLAARGVAPQRLHLEVTETALPDITEVTMQQVERLATAGVTWYADDFGTGYSSISLLRDLPISGVKLDRSFTRRLGAADSTSSQFARAIAALANVLRLDTVAEGVETAEQASKLIEQGWSRGQGWLFGRPVPASRIS